MDSIVKWLKKPWPYWVGGILLGLINVILLAVSGMTWHVTSGFMLWSAGILQWLGLEPFKWDYFNYFRSNYENIIASGSIFINKYVILDIAVVVGSLIATLLASQFKWKKVKDKKQVAFALIGGILMGYGARIAGGCNIGSFFSGIPSFSLHAWFFWIFVILGAWVGTKIITKFLI